MGFIQKCYTDSKTMATMSFCPLLFFFPSSRTILLLICKTICIMDKRMFLLERKENKDLILWTEGERKVKEMSTEIGYCMGRRGLIKNCY